MATGKFVAYYRVSTKRQGRSGLGLDAQREAVEAYLNGGNWKLVDEYTETESGTKTTEGRPQLAAALAACRLHGATLVVARLDRLARNAAFLLALRDAGVEFVCVDMPQVDRFTVGVLALVAERTAETISQNTKAALAAARRRGVKLGNPDHLTNKARKEGTKASAKVRGVDADQKARDVVAFLKPLKDRRASLRDMVRELEARGVPTVSRRVGTRWTASAVRAAFLRVERLDEAMLPPRR